MKKELIVRNKTAFSNCSCFNKVNIELGEDLLKRKDDKVKEFIKNMMTTYLMLIMTDLKNMLILFN